MTQTRKELLARRAELLRDSLEMAMTPPPSGEQAGYAFDQAHDELEREIAAIEKQLVAPLSPDTGSVTPRERGRPE